MYTQETTGFTSTALQRCQQNQVFFQKGEVLNSAVVSHFYLSNPAAIRYELTLIFFLPSPIGLGSNQGFFWGGPVDLNP